MNVYHLHSLRDASHVLNAHHGGWDITRGFVVVAEDETQARSLVGQHAVGRLWDDTPNGCGEECKRGICLDKMEESEGYSRHGENVDGPCVWRDPKETACVEIATGAHGEPRLILRDYCAG